MIVSNPYRNTIPGAYMNQDLFFNRRQSIPSDFEGNPKITAEEWGRQCRRARNIARSLGPLPACGYMQNRGANSLDAARSTIHATLPGYSIK